MQIHLFSARKRIALRWAGALIVLTGAWLATGSAQPPLSEAERNALKTISMSPESFAGYRDATPIVVPVSAPVPAPKAVETQYVDTNIQQTGCSTCSSGLLGYSEPGPIFGGCAAGSCGTGCYPGRFKHCDYCAAEGRFGRLCAGLYECLCCPDPCYEPRWVPAANASLFVDSARPRTYMRLRWKSVFDLTFPDRAEYIWARADGSGKGPSPPDGVAGERQIDYDEFRHYMEAASGDFAAFIETPYRHTDPDTYAGHSGFSDLVVGTKNVLLDCELLQVTMQFKTYIPLGVAGKGLGTGHVSLEPSLLFALKLTESMFTQAQAAYWIPIAGDNDYAGDIFHYRTSLNHILYRPVHNIELIGTLEMSGWSVLDGAMTDINGTTFKARTHFAAVGPGLRLSICDEIDFGFGVQIAVTDDDFGKQIYHSELRWLF